jgi:pyruvate/2-oxoglutarate dehydrogenase complex dihydrolipoamide acyltransferase (E2) component
MLQLMVPDLGDGIEKVQVVAWHVKEGDHVRKDDDVVELVTDKAAFNVPSPVEGKLRTIKVQCGEEVSIGTVLGIIE